MNSEDFLRFVADASNLSLALLDDLAVKLLPVRFPSIEQWSKWVPWNLTFQLAVIRLWKIIYSIPINQEGAREQVLERIYATCSLLFFHCVTSVIFDFLEELRMAGFELLCPEARERLDQREDPGFYHSLKSATLAFFKVEKVTQKSFEIIFNPFLVFRLKTKNGQGRKSQFFYPALGQLMVFCPWKN